MAEPKKETNTESGTQTQQETDQKKIMSQNVHFILFIDSHTNVIVGKVFGKDISFTSATISILNEAVFIDFCEEVEFEY